MLSSNKKNASNRIVGFNVFWVYLYLFCLIFSLLTTVLFQYRFQSSMADAITHTLKPNLLNRDYQTAVDSISYFTIDHYDCIQYFADGNLSVEVPTASCQGPRYFVINKLINYPGSNNLMGKLYFYPKISSYVFSLLISIVFSFLLLVVVFGFYKFSSEKDMQIQNERSRLEAARIIAEQLKHDIKSPLLALNTLKKIVLLSDEQRMMLDSVTSKIKQICDGIEIPRSNDTVSNEFEFKGQLVKISALINELIISKKAEYSDLDINFTYDGDYDVFVDPFHLARALSNIVNNSYEAYAFSKRVKKVKINLYKDYNCCNLELTDDAAGFDMSILNSLGVRGSSSKSKEGRGLGLYHASKLASYFDIALTFGNLDTGGAMVVFKFSRFSQKGGEIS